MAEITLVPLAAEDRRQFVLDNQRAFRYGAMEEFGERDSHFEEDGEIISASTIENCIDSGTAYRIMDGGTPVGGLVLNINEDTGHNHLDLLFVDPDAHSKGIGFAAWQQVEKLYPQTRVWETCTPYFETRNIHFYVNKCGFRITEFFCSRHPDPHDPETGMEEDYGDGGGMFRFIKEMDPAPQPKEGPRLQTGRLILRPFRMSDAPDVYEYLREPQVNCFESMRLWSVGEAEEEIAGRQGNEEYYLAIELRESGKVIGEIFSGPEDHGEGAADTFSPCWMLNRDYQGKGYAYEAAEAYLDYLFREKGARRVYAYTEDYNLPCQRLCGKLGMRREGEFKEFVSFVKEPDGSPRYENTLQYAILKKEWDARKSED